MLAACSTHVQLHITVQHDAQNTAPTALPRTTEQTCPPAHSTSRDTAGCADPAQDRVSCCQYTHPGQASGSCLPQSLQSPRIYSRRRQNRRHQVQRCLRADMGAHVGTARSYKIAVLKSTDRVVGSCVAVRLSCALAVRSPALQSTLQIKSLLFALTTDAGQDRTQQLHKIDVSLRALGGGDRRAHAVGMM